jgi:hypothetical protein
MPTAENTDAHYHACAALACPTPPYHNVVNRNSPVLPYVAKRQLDTPSLPSPRLIPVAFGSLSSGHSIADQGLRFEAMTLLPSHDLALRNQPGNSLRIPACAAGALFATAYLTWDVRCCPTTPRLNWHRRGIH